MKENINNKVIDERIDNGVVNEIEGKWLLREFPENLKIFKEFSIVQFIKDDITRYRIDNRFGDERILKIDKNVHGNLGTTTVVQTISTDEFTFCIEGNAYCGLPIVKTRSMAEIKGLKAEIDIFYGHLNGLILVELEFDTEEELLNYQLPEIFGENRNVTFDSRFKNKNLCTFKGNINDLVEEIFSKQ